MTASSQFGFNNPLRRFAAYLIRFAAHFKCAAKRDPQLTCAAKRGPHSTAAVLAAVLLLGCGDGKPADSPQMGAIVYVDLVTQSPVVQLATSEVPAVHPDTGRRTLMPGLYCPTCERWHPTPSFETLQRTPGAALCPKHGTPLTTDGPWPQGDQQ